VAYIENFLFLFVTYQKTIMWNKVNFQAFLCLLLLPFLGTAQKERIDYAKIPIDDPSVQILWDSLWVLNKQHRYFETFPILYKLEVLAKEKGETQVLVGSLENIATLLQYKGELEKAKEYIFKAYNVYEENGKLGSLSALMSAASNIEQYQGNLEEAFKHSYKAKNLLEYVDFKGPFETVHNDLGVLHHITGQFDSAYYYRKIVVEYIDKQDSTHFNKANINLASTLISINDYDRADEYLNTALAYTNHSKYPLTYGNTLGHQGKLDYLKGNYEEAENKMAECIEVLEKSKNNSRRLLEYYPEYASILIKNNKPELAEIMLDKADNLVQDDNHQLKIAYYFPRWELAIKNKNRELSSTIYELIKPLYREDHLHKKARFYRLESQHFDLLDNDEKALNSLKNYLSVKDTLRNLLEVRSIENLEIKYETEKKDASIASAEQRITFQRNGLIAGSAMLLSLLFLLYKNNLNRKKISNQNQIITKSLEEKEILLKEIHHRVKNNLQVISSLLSIQSRGIKDVKAKEAILEGKTRVHSMSLIHQDLYKKDNLTGVQMDRYLGNLTRDLLNTYNISEGKISLNNEIDPLKLDVESVIPLGLIVNELISNALKYAFPENRDGRIDVVLKEVGDALHLKVADNGVGLNEDQLRIKKDSFGHTLIRAFKNKLNADIDIKSKDGTIVSLTIGNYKKVV